MAENNCVVCFKNCYIYSVGECDHPVCYECSTRMRVLCLQNECPMCRHEMEMVVFTEKIRPFRRLKRKYALYDSKHNIAFDSSSIREMYDNLLHFICKECQKKSVFDSFQSLNEHMEKEHNKYCCGLCADSLKIFPAERRYYTERELNRHRSKGDVDDKSHRGHPLCEFCNDRYVDRDELYRHLRKEHLFCHICDREGIQQFYGAYEMLRHHYRGDHFLCEEGECFKEQLTSVFPTELDLKIHKALVHNKNGRHKNRTLELEFALPSRGFKERHDKCNSDNNNPDNQNSQSNEQSAAPISLEQDFPSLTNTTYFAPKLKISQKTSNRLAFNDQNFPALGQNQPLPSTSNSVPPSAAAQVKSKKLKGKNQLQANSLSISWVKKTKQKNPVEKKGENCSEFARPPVLDRENFPNLQPDDISQDSSQSGNKLKNQKKPSVSNKITNDKQTKINYSEMIAKNTTSGIARNNEKESAGPSRAKDKKSDTRTSSSKEKISNFLLNANRKKVKMKPDVLVPLKKFNENYISLPVQIPTNSNEGNSKSAPTSVSKSETAEANCDKRKSEKKVKENPAQKNKENDIMAATNENGEKKKTANKMKETANDKSNNKNTKKSNEKQNQPEKQKTETPTQSNGVSDGENSRNTMKVSKPPPGFETQSIKAPPGLAPLNCHQTLTIENPASSCKKPLLSIFKYQKPPEYVSRNFKLFEKIRNSMNKQNETALNEFKNMSFLFTEGYITAYDYYMYCSENIKNDTFVDVFVDLVALLPDIAKQMELWTFHLAINPTASQNALVTSCTLCCQILKLDDTTLHYSGHGMANDLSNGLV